MGLPRLAPHPLARQEATPVAQPPAEADAFPADGAAAATGGVWHALVSVAGQEPGYRKTNQDTAFLLANWGGADDTTLIGVFDGHGPHGHSVAGHLREAVPPAMRDGMSGGGGVSHGLRSAFGHVDRALCRGGSSGIDTDFSGSTAVVGLMAGENLTVAWTGDSRAVVGRRLRGGGFTAVALTEDHKPDNPGEAARIASVGGRVEQLVDDKGTRVGPHRVWLRSVWTPGLAMSRALGDAVAHTAGVSSEPEVTQHVLTHDDVVIVFATDGLWEFVTNEEAIQLACGQPTPAAAARVLVDEAVRRWVEEEDGVCDDTTVVVVFRKGGPQGGSGAGGGAGGGA